MPLTRPQFSLEVYQPHYHGLATKFGLSRDWRCYVEGDENKCAWELQNAEYIEPLRAVGPSALIYPRDMTGWTVGAGESDKFVTGEPSWAYEATSYQFVDGAAYTAGTDPSTVNGNLVSGTQTDALIPRFAVWMYRKPPSPQQGIFAGWQMSVPTIYTDNGTDKPGRLTFTLPLAQRSDTSDVQWDAPILHHILDEDWSGSYTVPTDGTVLDYGPKSAAMTAGGGADLWVFEYEEDADLYDGGHIIIRNLSGSDTLWWHYHDRNLRLTCKDDLDAAGITGYSNLAQWQIAVQGAVQTFNVTPLVYGDNTATASGKTALPLPDEVAANALEADSHADDGASAWGTLTSEPDSGWAVGVASHSDGTRRPTVTMTRTLSAANRERPILWIGTEHHRAVIGDANTTIIGDTEGDDRLHNVSWTWGANYKRSRGSANFIPETSAYYEDWRENCRVLLRLGWSAGAGTGLEVGDFAEGYIPAGGIPRMMDGDVAHGDPLMRVEFGSYDDTRLPNKDVIDARQAGGMTVEDWAEQILGDGVGIPSSRIYVDSAVADTIIPTNEIPSLPSLAARDGDSWQNHVQQVEHAAHIRVCWNRTLDYDIYVDAGPPEYDPATSTIALELDYQATVDAEKTYRLEARGSVERYRNMLKAIAGPADDRVTYYLAQRLADRKTGIGDTWGVVLADDDAELGELYQVWYDEHWEGKQAVLDWVMPMRPDLNPDDFIRITNCPGVGVTDNSVYRLVEHSIDTDANGIDADSTLFAVLVWTPGEGGTPLNAGGLNAGGLN